ncbi:SDR family oxidoreductase [bacterium]|nr:SDR family oxidoreductase [bacterium]MBT6832266.1 SDR family oxidoreductase [bacterium]MBT6996203.1 SDR family oxidoreductase [bacterium]MBT7772450.1 SDR family oxidoreductase [bacterium]
MQKVLVTGGAGFVGFHLCKKLLSLGKQVFCLDNLYTGSQDNIAEFQGDKNFEFIEHDICNPIFLEVDEIYNLACPASPVHYQRSPIATTKTCTVGVLNMLELAKKAGAKLLQASTSEVYGNPFVHPQPESYWGNVNPVGIRSCYDEGKRCAETFIMDYHRQYDLPIKIVRIFNTYGPKMLPDDGRVISNFIVQALKNDPLTIYGDGIQTRSFQFVDDLVDGMIKMMEQDHFIGPVNLGNPDEFTIEELAREVLKLIPESTSKIVYKDLPEDDPLQRKPDISLAQKELNWKPQIKLEQGLKNTIEYFRQKI